jgi:hypothetical protein
VDHALVSSVTVEFRAYLKGERSYDPLGADTLFATVIR